MATRTWCDAPLQQDQGLQAGRGRLKQGAIHASVLDLVRRRLDEPHSRPGLAGGGRGGARGGSGGQGRWGLDLRQRDPTPAIEHRCDKWDHLSRTRTGNKGGHRRVFDH